MNRVNLQLILGDKNPEMISAWERWFMAVPDIVVRGGNLLLAQADALVSPANSFGFMDGGIDWSISDLMGWRIQPLVQDAIQSKYAGELPVGMAEVIETGHDRFKYLVCAPTMRTPRNVANSMNAYLAMRAVLLSVLRHNNSSGKSTIKSVAIPGLCTGAGQMPYERCARQMRAAYDFVAGNKSNHYKSLSDAIADERELTEK